jgi:drug/metabolite transporter (DMT)-like permease
VVVGRFVFAAIVLWSILLISRRPAGFKTVGIRPVIMGCLDPGLVSIFMVWGVFHTAAVNAAVFWALMPLIMPVLARIFLGEKVSAIVVLSALIAVSASLWLVSMNASSGEGSLFGDFLALCGIACAAVNGLLARTVARAKGNPMATTTYQMSSAILIGLLAILLLPSAGGDSENSFASGWFLLLVYLGVFSTAGPFFLLNYALQHLPIARTSLFSSLVGPFALPLAAIFLGETVTLLEVTAVAIVLCAVLLPRALEAIAARSNASSDG